MKSATARLEFRRGGPADFDGLIELNRQTYGDDFFTHRRYFDWQYANGTDGPALVYVAEAEGRVIGTYNLILQTLWVFGQPCLAAHGVGAVVHEDYSRHLTREGGRLRTVFARLADLADADCAQRGIALTFSFPNEKSYPTFIQLLGFTDMGPLPFYARAVRPGATLAARWPGPAGMGRVAGRSVDALVDVARTARLPRMPRGISIEEVVSADARFDALWEHCRPPRGIIRQRDRAYARWRLFEHPAFEYRVWMAQRGKEPLAYVAVMTAAQKDRARGTVHRLGHIVDFLCAPDDGGEGGSRILSGLIAHAVRELQRERVEFIIAAHSGPGAGRAALRSAGLYLFPPKRAPRRWPAVVRIHRPDLLPAGGNVEALDNWFIHLSDNDIA